MDIQVSSNFERLLFNLDPAAVPEQMAAFARDRAMRLTGAQRSGAEALFSSARIDATEMTLAMRWACEGAGQILDPHTAVGLAAARAAELPGGVPVVTLATAHPAKFRDAVERATGVRPSLPPRVGSLFERDERFDTLPAELGPVTAYIAERATARA
jgi:threonine synthase